MIRKKSEFIRNFFIAIIIVLSILFVLSCTIENSKILIIQNNTTGMKYQFSLTDNGFSLGYTHSVMKTPAEEFFHIDVNNNIILEKTIYESFGVGLPFLSEPENFEIKDDKFILYTNRSFEKLNMIISPIPKHYIKIGGIKYDMIELLKENDCSITIYVQEENIIKSFVTYPQKLY